MRRHLTKRDTAARWLLALVFLMLSSGTIYLYATLIVDLPRPPAGTAFALTAALVVSVTCLTILRGCLGASMDHGVSSCGDCSSSLSAQSSFRRSSDGDKA